jgi:hypothetical protein
VVEETATEKEQPPSSLPPPRNAKNVVQICTGGSCIANLFGKIIDGSSEGARRLK